MMKKFFTIHISLIALFLSCIHVVQAEVPATSTSSGRTGGSKVYSVQPLSQGTFGFGYQTDYFQGKRVPFPKRNTFLGHAFFANYTPTPFLNIFANQKSSIIQNETFFSSLQSHVFNQVEIGTTYIREVDKTISVGVEPSYTLYHGEGVKAFDAYGLGLRFLGSYKSFLYKKKYPLNVHMNIRYFKNETSELTKNFNFNTVRRTQLYGISGFDSIQYGIGTELQISKFTPYVEYTIEYMLEADVPLFKNPNRLTTGVKYHPTMTSPINVNLGVDLGLAPKRYKNISSTPQFNFFAGISYLGNRSKPSAYQEEKSAESPRYSETSIIKKVYPLKKSEMSKYPIKKIEYTVEPPKEQTIVTKKVEEEVHKEKPKTVKKTQEEITTSLPFDNHQPDVFEPGSSEKSSSKDAPNKDFLKHFK